eukprot:TRINITY_DN6100_c1_g1_i2.p2 TRINITY_DN6100_c1_g1~~TRINITY_DN6100_c1_g1_i2.p2  ORF type:complete len:281 (-),score=18.16 TRINITY_DN6100_c1_g1_i2:982-1824(-)
MSSLAAAKADNFYYPPEWDPKKGSINKFQGQHPLRERAKRIDEGILIVRFEMPFNIWCQKCEEMIAKGVRFNAEKKQIGSYFSTKIWSFRMTHHCGCVIDIHTDPKNTKYVIKEGAREKVVTWENADLQVIDLGSNEHRQRMKEDPLYRLEVQQETKSKSKANQQRLEQLHSLQDLKHDDAFYSNSILRKSMRLKRREEKRLESKRDMMGLHETVKLLPTSKKDVLNAKTAAAKQRGQQQSQLEVRKRIMGESIFGEKGGGFQAQLQVKKLRMKPNSKFR